MKLALHSTKKHQYKKTTFVKPTSRFSFRDISVCTAHAEGFFKSGFLRNEDYYIILQQADKQQMRKVSYNVRYLISRCCST